MPEHNSPSPPAVGVDIGGVLVVRYDEARCEVVGLTVIGLKDRLLEGIEHRG